MKGRTKVVVAGLAVVVVVAFILFAPVVSLIADVPNTGGFSTTTTVQGNTTSTLTMVGTPEYGQALGSITFCYYGLGGLLMQGTFYILSSPTLQTTDNSCPALRPNLNG
jgi:hypothetical protein